MTLENVQKKLFWCLLKYHLQPTTVPVLNVYPKRASFYDYELRSFKMNPVPSKSRT